MQTTKASSKQVRAREKAAKRAKEGGGGGGGASGMAARTGLGSAAFLCTICRVRIANYVTHWVGPLFICANAGLVRFVVFDFLATAAVAQPTCLRSGIIPFVIDDIISMAGASVAEIAFIVPLSSPQGMHTIAAPCCLPLLFPSTALVFSQYDHFLFFAAAVTILDDCKRDTAKSAFREQAPCKIVFGVFPNVWSCKIACFIVVAEVICLLAKHDSLVLSAMQLQFFSLACCHCSFASRAFACLLHPMICTIAGYFMGAACPRMLRT